MMCVSQDVGVSSHHDISSQKNGIGTWDPGVACQVCPLSLSIITATPSLSEKVMVKIDTFVGYNDNKISTFTVTKKEVHTEYE
jgi:hypothetical protein